MRLARSAGGGVDYWMGLPINELVQWLTELCDQLREEHEAQKELDRR
jgi:membrane protein YqaA with SNARE-associated domain